MAELFRSNNPVLKEKATKLLRAPDQSRNPKSKRDFSAPERQKAPSLRSE